MIKQLEDGRCVSVETLDDLRDVLSEEQLQMVQILIDEYDEQIEELENEIEDLQEDNQEMEQQIEALEEDTASLEERLNDL